jgi:hypothetical protein
MIRSIKEQAQPEFQLSAPVTTPMGRIRIGDTRIDVSQTFPLIKYEWSGFVAEPVVQGQFNLAEALAYIENFPVREEMQKLSALQQKDGPGIAFYPRDTDILKVNFSSGDSVSIWLYYFSGHVQICNITRADLARVVRMYYSMSHYRLFRRLARSGLAYVTFSSRTVGKLLRWLVRFDLRRSNAGGACKNISDLEMPEL